MPLLDFSGFKPFQLRARQQAPNQEAWDNWHENRGASLPQSEVGTGVTGPSTGETTLLREALTEDPAYAKHAKAGGQFDPYTGEMITSQDSQYFVDGDKGIGEHLGDQFLTDKGRNALNKFMNPDSPPVIDLDVAGQTVKDMAGMGFGAVRDYYRPGGQGYQLGENLIGEYDAIVEGRSAVGQFLNKFLTPQGQNAPLVSRMAQETFDRAPVGVGFQGGQSGAQFSSLDSAPVGESNPEFTGPTLSPIQLAILQGEDPFKVLTDSVERANY